MIATLRLSGLATSSRPGVAVCFSADEGTLQYSRLFLESAQDLACAFAELLVAAHLLGVLPRVVLPRQVETGDRRVEPRGGDHALRVANELLAPRDLASLPLLARFRVLNLHNLLGHPLLRVLQATGCLDEDVRGRRPS